MSRFAKRFTGFSGTAALMEDLGNALNNNPELLFMGGGNPAKIDEAEQCFAKHLQHIAQDPQALHKLVGEYQPSQGDPAFLEVLADFLCAQYQWPISAENIAISNGGQSAFLVYLICWQATMSRVTKIIKKYFCLWFPIILAMPMLACMRICLKHIRQKSI